MRASSAALLLLSWLETLILSLAQENINNGSAGNAIDGEGGMTIYFCMAPIKITNRDNLEKVYNWKVNATGLVRQSIAIKPTSFFEVLNLRLEFDNGPAYSRDYSSKDFLVIVHNDRWYQVAVETYTVEKKTLFDQELWGLKVIVDGREFEHPTDRSLREYSLTGLVVSAKGNSQWAPGGYAVLCNTEWSVFAIIGTIILLVIFGCIFLCVKKCQGAGQ